MKKHLWCVDRGARRGCQGSGVWLGMIPAPSSAPCPPGVLLASCTRRPQWPAAAVLPFLLAAFGRAVLVLLHVQPVSGEFCGVRPLTLGRAWELQPEVCIDPSPRGAPLHLQRETGPRILVSTFLILTLGPPEALLDGRLGHCWKGSLGQILLRVAITGGECEAEDTLFRGRISWNPSVGESQDLSP